MNLFSCTMSRFFPTKSFLLAFFIAFAPLGLCLEAQSSPQQIFQQANEAYEAEHYADAADLYLQLIPDHQSAALHYNLGNTYYRLNQFGPAILHYEKALALQPSNPDIRANLKLAREAAQLPDTTPNWAQSLALKLPANSWAWITTSCFWIALACILLPRLWDRQSLLTRSVATLTILVFLTGIVALYGWHHLAQRGIALSEEAALKNSPTNSAAPQHYLKAGESATILRRHGSYYFIETPTGLSGWISSNTFQPIWS